MDDGMGTRIQAEKLEEPDVHDERFKDFNEIDANGVPVYLKGNNDSLICSKPDMIKDIHKEYFAAGSDICETNTFNGTTISQGEYKMQPVVYDLTRRVLSLPSRQLPMSQRRSHTSLASLQVLWVLQAARFLFPPAWRTLPSGI